MLVTTRMNFVSLSTDSRAWREKGIGRGFSPTKAVFVITVNVVLIQYSSFLIQATLRDSCQATIRSSRTFSHPCRPNPTSKYENNFFVFLVSFAILIRAALWEISFCCRLSWACFHIQSFVILNELFKFFFVKFRFWYPSEGRLGESSSCSRRARIELWKEERTYNSTISMLVQSFSNIPR